MIAGHRARLAAAMSAAGRRRSPLRAAIGALTLCLTACLAPAAQAIPSFDSVRAAHRPSDFTLLDRHGVPVQTLRVDKTVRRLDWVPLERMSPALLQAIVLSEDQRFHEHSGIDWAAVARSAWANAWNTRTRGASTVTMQLAGLLDDGLARPAGGRSVAQKIGQALTATQLERQWRKRQILEAYLNAVPWRGELVGIGALSQSLFGKHPSGLDHVEAAIAAALVRAPNAPAARVAQRACELLRQQQLDCAAVDAITAMALVRPGGMPLGEQLAPHFARQALVTSGPPQQRSTLDAGVQRLAIAALRAQLSELQGRNVEDGAVVVLDNVRGEVLAWVGSAGPVASAQEVDGVLARRQPGSTLKPFVYELAFEQRLITPASLLEDSPVQLATSAGLYLPQNYDRAFKGWVSARTALGASLNIPAVRVGALLDQEALFTRLNALGFALPHNAGYYGPALALGGADVTLLALANAYRSLARGGLHSEVTLRAGLPGPDVAKPRRVATAEAVHLVTDILADNSARALTFGLSSSLTTAGFAAVKTGTSKDLRDNWCVGFTDRYTVAVWVGNASGAPMHDVSGVSGAAPVWQALVRQLHAGRPSVAPELPAGVVRQAVRFASGEEPARDELFIAGTQQATLRAGAPRFGITSPRDGSVFALDPDIPPAAQRLTFSGESGTWVLDGRRLGTSSQVTWAPWPGRHELTLVGRDGQVRQTVRFEVRGAKATVARARP